MMHANFDWPSVEPLSAAEAIPELLLPVQFSEPLQRSSQRTGEQRLMAGVLEDAIRSYCRYAGCRGTRALRIFGETAEWFESSDVSWPFAFENICDALALDAGWIRRLLRQRVEVSTTASQRKISSMRRLSGPRRAESGPALGLRPTRMAC